jgi:hypothetical protein
MSKFLTALVAVAATFCASAEVWDVRYGVAEVFNFKLYNADGTLDVDEADSGTEVSLSCNEGAETTATNDFADEGNFYSISLTAAELQCERVAVVIAATTTEVFFIQTHSHASALTPTYEANVASVTSGVIQAADFASGAIDATAIAADAIGASELATDAIGAAELASAAIAADEIATDAIGAAEIAADAITTAELATGSVSADEIAADAIGASELATDAIGAAELAAGAIAAAEIATDAIDADAIAADAIGASEHAVGAIAADAFAAGAVDAAAIAANAIDAATFAADVDAEVLSYIVDDATRIDASELNADVDSLTFTVAGDVDANMQGVSGDTAVADRLEAIYDATVGAYPEMGVIRGIGITAQSYTHSTGVVVIDSAAAFADNALQGGVIMLCGNTSGCQSASIASNLLSGDAVTLNDPLEDDIEGETITFTIYATPQTTASSGLTAADVWAESTRTLTALDEDTTTLDINSTTVGTAAAVTSLSSGAITEASYATTAGSFDGLGIVDQGTAQAATATTLQLRSAAAFADDEIIGATCLITGGTGVGQSRSVTDYVSSTDTATVETWTTTPSGTILYQCYGTAPGAAGSLTAADVWAAGTRTLTALDEDSTTIDLNASYVGGVTVFDEDLTTIDINATTLGTVTTATTATNVTTVNGFANDALVAADIAADVTTELQNGLATAASIAALNDIAASDLRDLVIEDQGGGVSLGCAIAVVLAYAAGDLATAGSDSTYEDPSGTETRAEGTVASAGNRTAAITCPTY